MLRTARLVVATLGLLIISSGPVTQATAGQTGTDDLWDIIGTQCYPVPQGVEFQNFGIALSFTPVVNSRSADSGLVFILLDDAILFNSGSGREPRWEFISEREFRKLIAELEDAGFDLTAEIVDEEFILGVVLMF